MGSRRVALPCLVVLLLVGAHVPSAEGATRLVAGSCLIDLEVDRTATSIDVTTPNPGSCLTSSGAAEASITGSATTAVGSGCAAGVALGTARLDLELTPTLGLSWTGLDVVVTYAEPVVEVALVRHDATAHVVGSATFEQVPLSDPACDTTSGATFTWSGALAFEDPTTSEP